MGVIMGRRQLLGHRMESQSWSSGRHSGTSGRRAVIPIPSRDGEENIWLALPCLLKETTKAKQHCSSLLGAQSERLGGAQLTVPHLWIIYTVALVGGDVLSPCLWVNVAQILWESWAVRGDVSCGLCNPGFMHAAYLKRTHSSIHILLLIQGPPKSHLLREASLIS